MDMVDMTCKFVGDASLNNNSFIHCRIYWLGALNTGGVL